jgi:DNA processing protein
MDEFALAFSVSNIGPKGYQRLLAKFENSKAAWEGEKEEFYDLGIKDVTYEKFDKFRKSFDINKYVLELKKAGSSYVSFTDRRYPDNLKRIENPPIGLFVKGNDSLLSTKLSIGVVGTRKMTSYGREVTEFLVLSLVQNDVCIISGLALGVDGAAHRAAVMNHGKTIAVLACGVDCCTPSENYSLYSDILKNNGLVISEYPLSQPPNKGTFLARNRIVAALSNGILITEAAFGSGSLVTADYALKYGKKVFAVPGPINSKMSEGSTSLLKKGAKLVTEVEDILREFSISNAPFSLTSKMKKFNLSKEEKKIVSLLENEGMTIDEVSKKIKISHPQLMALISGLELKKIIINRSGKFSLEN